MFFNKKKLKITDHLQQSSELSSRGVSLLFNEICARNSYIEQLTEIGLVDEVLPNGVLIEWEKFYAINSDLEHQDSLPLLAMPEFINLTPILSSSGALTDGTFQVNITGWRNGDGIRLSFQDAKLRFNPVIDYQHRVYLLTYPVWHLISAILEFAAISSAQKTTENNYRHWGKIRRLALNANCVLDNFLSKTVVLTPEKLHLQLDQDADVVTISPTFIEAPSDWLERFDHLPNVPDYYHLPQTDGSQIEIALTEPVKQVLQEIKRMPKRTVRGKRAQAFLRNPYACLGNLALGVITPESYEQSLEQSGIIFYRFTLGAKQDAKGNIINITMQLIANRVTPVFNNTTFEFSTPDELVQLINEIEIQLQEQAPCFNWKGYEIELCGDSDRQYQNLKQWYQSWLTPINLLAYEDIFQFSEYSKRVLEIGVRKPYYSPFILKNDDEKSPWIPTELTITIGTVQEHTGEITAYLPIRNEDDINRLEDALQEAKNHSATEFNYDGLPKPINIFEAEQICQLARGSFEAIKHGKQPEQLQKTTLRGQKTLVIQTNITEIEYSENSQTSKPIVFDKTSTDYLELPEALKVTLKPHQTVGVAWLQHLWRHCPTHYAGCMVADDMGLGKTLQLLTFIHWYLAKPTPLPVLVVAPVSLLDNWQNELQKFFHPGVVKLLTLYGKTLQQKKIAQSLIDERLREESLNNFLADNWLEDANVVLTTYETLRDLSISMGRQTWGVMICDEAQKIKTPGTLVTDAAKAQKAQFKIACTGTPVENSLTDLWCLFDFVHPGLLGPLNAFGTKYRRPIEIERSDEQRALRELQVIIDPQIMRRLKADIASDLPIKYDDRYESVRQRNRILLNDYQKALYQETIQYYKEKTQEQIANGEKRNNVMLQLLHRLRGICADPRVNGLQPDLSIPLEQYRKKSPKIDWLIKVLDDIYRQNEKVLIFTEFLDLQRTLQHYLKLRYTFKNKQPYIINGSVKSNSTSRESRQKFIDEFQESDGFNILILSPIAAGFGLNIQAANHVIHFTRPWNPAKEDQATDRAYRIGQTKDVYVYYPTIYSEEFLTFEAKLDDLLRKKRELATDMLNGTPELKTQEFAELFDEIDNSDSSNNNCHINDKHLDQIVGKNFEILCSQLWSRQGYFCSKTPSSGDGGIDIIAIKGDFGQLIQCKASTVTRNLGWDAIKDVVAGATAYEKQFPNVKFQKVAVTNQYFNSNASRHAENHNVTLVQKNELKVWLDKYPILLSIFSQV